VLWHWVARVLGQVLAHLAYWDADSVGGGADVGDRCEQGVLPEVVRLPPGDLIEQVRVGPAAQRCRYKDRVLVLLVLPAAECALGQEPLSDPLQGQRVSAAGPDQSSASAARRRRTSPGKVLSRGCNGASSLSSSKMSASRASPSSSSWRAAAASSGAGRFL